MNSNFICSAIIVLIIIVETIMFIRVKNKKTKLIYPFEPDGDKSVEVNIKGVKWDKISIWFEGKQAGVFSRKELHAGQDLQISDGSLLNLLLSKNKFQPERLKISRNGQPIHRIVTEAMHQVLIDYASNAIYFIGITTMGLGIVSLFVRIKILEPLTFGWLYIIFGSVFLVLGFFVRRRSMLALMVAIIIYALDGLAGVVIIISALSTGSYILVGNPLMHLVLLMAMINGIDGINATRHKPKSRIVAALTIATAGILIITPFLIIGWGIRNIIVIVHPANPFSIPPIATQGVEQAGNSCTLTIKDTAGSVYMRDKADATYGEIVDYLDVKDMALVLGSDGGNPGDAWWNVSVTHRGKTSMGWVFGNLVELGNSESCSNIQQVATPFP
jgi:hypothetical protein